jgi:WD40 repeat protein
MSGLSPDLRSVSGQSSSTTKDDPVRPYVGLVPYGEEDSAFFFGREAECEIISANLLASRLTLLYGASGVGKSSVIRAGVANKLHQLADDDMAHPGAREFVVVVFSAWRDNPVESLAQRVGEAAQVNANVHRTDAGAPTGSLAKRLGEWAARVDGDLLIILDQFEEYFLYHGNEDGAGAFAVEFPQVLMQPDLHANFLVSIREDALAKLDLFKGRVPYLFDNYLRIRHLDAAAARRAILLPIEEYNQRTGPSNGAVRIEPSLVDAVLEQVQTGQVVLEHGGSGVVHNGDSAGAQIETPYLQLVMTRLWDEEKSQGSHTLRLETLTRLGGAQRIVRTHLDEVMDALPPESQRVAARAFRYLVTPSRTKIAHTTSDLAEYAGLPETELTPVLERLSAGDVRILRPVEPPPDQPGKPRYEIFHDVLAAAVLDWRSRYEQARAQEEAAKGLQQEKLAAEERARKERRRSRRLLAVALASVIVSIAVGYSWVTSVRARNDAREAGIRAEKSAKEALVQRDEADRQRAAAQSGALIDEALSRLSTDPQKSLQLALQALDQSGGSTAEEVLRQALSESRVRAVLSGHDAVVWAAGFSPTDANLVATASGDGSARIWSNWKDPGGVPIILPGTPGRDVVGLAFSQNGDRLVTAGLDGIARVWDVQTGSKIRELPLGGQSKVQWATAAFNSTGTKVVTAVARASEDGSAQIWDLGSDSGPLTLDPPTNASTAVFDGKGDKVVTAGDDGKARIWNAATGKLLHELDGLTERVNGAVFSPDGKLVAEANSDGTVGIFAVAKGNLIAWLTGHDDEVVSIEFSQDGKRLVSAGGTTALVWDASNWESSAQADAEFPYPLATISGKSWIDMATFSPAGDLVITAGQDGIATVSESLSGRELFELRGHADIVWSAAFSPDGRDVVTASEDKTARVWEVVTGTNLQLNAEVLSARFSHDGGLVVTASADGSAVIWNTRDGTRVQELGRLNDYGVRVVDFSRDDTKVLVASGDGAISVWGADQSRWKLLARCCIGPPAWSAVFDDTGDRILVSYGSGPAEVWDWRADDLLGGKCPDTGPCPGKLGRNTDVLYASYSADGTRVVTVGRFRAVRVWDASTGKEFSDAQLKGPTGRIFSARFSDDGKFIVTASTDRTVVIWNVGDGSMVRTLNGNTRAVFDAAFSHDGRWVVSAGADGTTQVWDIATGLRLAVLRMHADAVNSVEFALGDRLILSASGDWTAKIYSCELCGELDLASVEARAQIGQ